jgi:outer membrane protein insertion porin family
VALSNDAGIEIADPKEPDSLTTRYTRSVESFSIGWDTRDHPLMPRRGHFLGAMLSESGALYGAHYRWWKSIWQARVLVPFGRLWTAAGKTEFDFMGPLYQSHVTPVTERFKLGGASTVRGWGREQLSPRASDGTPIGGDLAFSATTEIRRNIWGPASLALFVDIGNVWSRPYRFKILNMYPSAGPGLLVMTPVGPIRVDYGYQLRPNPFGEKRWAIHLSLGSPF